MTVYGEDGWWRRDGAPIGGSEAEPPLQIDPFDAVILRSGFALRDDDLWRLSQLRDLAECHQCDVASLPPEIHYGFLSRRGRIVVNPAFLRQPARSD